MSPTTVGFNCYCLQFSCYLSKHKLVVARFSDVFLLEHRKQSAWHFVWTGTYCFIKNCLNSPPVHTAGSCCLGCSFIHNLKMKFSYWKCKSCARHRCEKGDRHEGFAWYFQRSLANLFFRGFVVPVINNVIKMFERGQVIKTQSQRNCPLLSK